MLRPDGTSVYITQDLYLAKLRYEEYKFDELIYVVANEQNYHFNVLFTILNLLNYSFADKLKHFSYGMVFLPEGRMKSREGKIVDADDLIEEMLELARKELRKRYELEKKEEESRALKIALSAIKYFLLKIDAKKDMIFEPGKAIDFEGNTGTYLQYSYARACSILKKAKYKEKKEVEIKNLKEQEIKLIKKLSDFPLVFKATYKNLNPCILANYAFQLAQTFSEFYHSCPVIKSEEKEKRLSLVHAFKIVMEQSLFLLGIEAIEEM